jgi:hypothetical protein
MELRLKGSESCRESPVNSENGEKEAGRRTAADPMPRANGDFPEVLFGRRRVVEFQVHHQSKAKRKEVVNEQDQLLPAGPVGRQNLSGNVVGLTQEHSAKRPPMYMCRRTTVEFENLENSVDGPLHLGLTL